MPIASINGINLYHEVMGTGQPVVFVPGLGGATDLWAYQTHFFKEHFQTISLDNRGAGKSDKPCGPYSMALFSQDLHALLDHLKISEPVILVGASMGGIIAQAFMHDYPHRVKKLVLACTGVSAGDPHITLSSVFVRAKLANPGSTAEERVKTYLDIFYHPDFVAARPDLKDLFLKRQESPQPEHAYQAQLAACADQRPYYEWLADIKVPTLIIHGDDDVVWPLKNAETLKAGMGDNAALFVMKKAGHVLMLEKPAEFNDVLNTFFHQA